MKKNLIYLFVVAFAICSILGISNNADAQDIKHISIAGAGTAGTFYIMASGFAHLINEEMGIDSVAEVTAGSVENAKLIDGEKVEFAVMQLDVMQNAVNGVQGFDKPIDICAVLPMYPNVVQIITLKDSPINSFSDLKGKKVSVGSPGSGVLATNRVIFETLGMTFDDIDPQYLSFAENTTALRNGNIEAAIVNTAAPSPFVMDLETTHPVKLISFSEDEIQKFKERFPYFVEATIPQSAYTSLEDGVSTFAVWITLATRKNIPEDVVYEVTKTIFESEEYLRDLHVVSQYISLKNVTKIGGVPFHPGAAKYYEDQGISVLTK